MLPDGFNIGRTATRGHERFARFHPLEKLGRFFLRGYIRAERYLEYRVEPGLPECRKQLSEGRAELPCYGRREKDCKLIALYHLAENVF